MGDRMTDGVVMEKWALAARFIGIGWIIGICIVLGFMGGRWMGQRLESEVFFSILGVMVGLMIAAIGAYQISLPIIKRGQGKNEEK